MLFGLIPRHDGTEAGLWSALVVIGLSWRSRSPECRAVCHSGMAARTRLLRLKRILRSRRPAVFPSRRGTYSLGKGEKRGRNDRRTRARALLQQISLSGDLERHHWVVARPYQLIGRLVGKGELCR